MRRGGARRIQFTNGGGNSISTVFWIIAFGSLFLIVGLYIFAGLNRGSIGSLETKTMELMMQDVLMENYIVQNASALQVEITQNSQTIEVLNDKTTSLMDKDMMIMSDIQELRNNVTLLNVSTLSNQNSILTLFTKTNSLMMDVMNLEIKDMALMTTDEMLQMEIDALKQATGMLSNGTMDLNTTVLELLSDLLMLEPEIKATWNKTTDNMMAITELQMQPQPIISIALNTPNFGGPIPPNSTGYLELTSTHFDSNGVIRIAGHSTNSLDVFVDFPTMAASHLSAGNGIIIGAADPIPIALDISTNFTPTTRNNGNLVHIVKGNPTLIGVRGEDTGPTGSYLADFCYIAELPNTVLIASNVSYIVKRVNNMVTVQFPEVVTRPLFFINAFFSPYFQYAAAGTNCIGQLPGLPTSGATSQPSVFAPIFCGSSVFNPFYVKVAHTDSGVTLQFNLPIAWASAGSGENTCLVNGFNLMYPTTAA